jgi:hypothetical protein
MAKEIVTIELDDAQLDAKIADLTKKLDEGRKAFQQNKKEIKDLEKEIKNLDKTDKDYEKTLNQKTNALVKLQSDNAKLVVSNRNLATQQRNLIASQSEEVGSLNRLRGQLNQALKEYDGLSEAQRNNIDVGGQQLKRIEELTKQVSVGEQATGRFQRQVGNYNGTGKIFADVLQQSGGQLGNVIKGVKGFNVALAANPIGAIVFALTNLLVMLTKLQPVTDALNIAFGAINATIDVLISRSKLLVDAFGFLIKGDLAGAADAAGNAFSGLVDDIGEAINRGREFAAIQKEVADTEQRLNIIRSEANIKIKQLEKQLRDTTKTNEERLKIAQELEETERRIADAELTNRQKNLEAQRRNIEALLAQQRVQLTGKETTEELIALAQEYALQGEGIKNLEDAQVALNNAQAQSIDLLERVQARRNKIQEDEDNRLERERQQRERQAELEAQRREKALEAERQYREKIQNLLDDFILDDREKLIKSFDDRLALIQGNGEVEIALRRSIEEAKQKALENFQLELEKKAFEERKAELNRQKEEELLILKAQFAAGLIEEEDYNRQREQMQVEFLENQLALYMQFGEDTTAIDNAILDVQLANIEKRKQAEAKAKDEALRIAKVEADARIGFAKATFGAFGSFAKQGSEIQKAAAIATIATSTGEGIARAVAAGAGVPFPANLAAIASGVGAVSSGISSAKQALGSAGGVSIPTPSFSAGDVGGGNLASSGLSARQIENQQLTQGISEALSELQIYTAVTDINDGQAAFTRITDRAER